MAHVSNSWRQLAAVLALLAGCKPEFSVPATASVSCEVDSNCPTDFRCRGGTCVSVDENLAPSLVLSGIRSNDGSRPLTALLVDFLIADPDDATATARVEYSVDSGKSWHAATPGEGASPGEVTVGTAHSFTWNLLADATSNHGLTAKPVPVQRGATGPVEEQVVGAATVLVRATPTDARGREGGTQVSAPLLVGNDAPAATIKAVEGHGGTIALELVVSDSSADPAALQLEFLVVDPAVDPAQAWRVAKLVLGATDGLGTTVDGSTYVVVWDSEAPLASDPLAPQGIGPNTPSGVRLRVRPSDSPGAGLRHFGAIAEFGQTLALRNQTPPRLEIDYVKNDGGLYDGVVPILYRVIDEQSDLADIACDLSLDDRATWRRCSESASSASEGTTDLASAPGAGVPHVFLWDSTADLPVPSSRLWLRLTPADHSEVGSAVYPIQLAPAGPSFGDPTSAMFPTTRVFPVGATPRSLAVADFNEDGVLDLAVGEWGAVEVRVMLGGRATSGTWDGTYAPASVSLHTISGPAMAMAAGDLDCDGHADLALGAGTSAAPQLEWLKGDGAGGFSAGGMVAVAKLPMALALADLDRDTRLDVIVAFASGTPAVAVLPGKGAPGACSLDGPQDVNVSGLKEGGQRGLEVADLDGDTFLDVAVSGGGLVVLSGHAPGAGGPLLTPGALISPNGTGPVAAADVDGDGRLDLLTPLSPDYRVGVFRGGPGGFTASSQGPFPGGSGPLALVSQDFNGDGVPDYALLSRYQKLIRVALGLTVGGAPTGDFWVAADVGLNGGPLDNGITIGADVDGDGALDLITTTNAGVEVQSTRRTNASGDTFASAIVTPARSPVRDEAGVADVNADGTLDYVVVGPEGLQVFQGGGAAAVGQAGLGSSEPSGPSGFSSVAALADLDGDHALDAVEFNLSSLQTMKGESTGGVPTGRFTAGPTTTLANPPLALVVDDFDSNGTWDAAVFETSGKNELFPGRGDGTFGPGTWDQGTVPVQDFSIAASADFNGDGRPDLLVGNNRAYVLLNQGNGKFASTGELRFQGPSGTRTGTGIAVADLNADGIPDLAISLTLASGGGEVLVMLGAGSNGRGTGVFDVATGVRYPLGALAYPTGIVAADLNDDGALDLAVADASADAATILWGEHAQTPTGRFPFPPVEFPSQLTSLVSLAAADFNGDGMLDLVGMGTGNQSVSVLPARREASRGTWVRAARGSSVLGAETAPVGKDRLGRVRAETFSQRRFHAGADRAPGSFAVQGADLLRQIRRALPATTGVGLTPVSDAWRTAGDVMLARVPDALTGSRLEVRHRFGPAKSEGIGRDGLSLASSNSAEHRALIARIPLWTGRPHDRLRLFLRTSDYLRAASVPTDPLSGTAAAAQVLPRIKEGTQWRDVVLEQEQWQEVPQAPLDSPQAGPCFEVRGAALHVRLDRLGVLQAFQASP